jgi:hypothetical protein
MTADAVCRANLAVVASCWRPKLLIATPNIASDPLGRTVEVMTLRVEIKRAKW